MNTRARRLRRSRRQDRTPYLQNRLQRANAVFQDRNERLAAVEKSLAACPEGSLGYKHLSRRRLRLRHAVEVATDEGHLAFMLFKAAQKGSVAGFKAIFDATRLNGSTLLPAKG